jgi:hypothetical protein
MVWSVLAGEGRVELREPAPRVTLITVRRLW